MENRPFRHTAGYPADEHNTRVVGFSGDATHWRLRAEVFYFAEDSAIPSRMHVLDFINLTLSYALRLSYNMMDINATILILNYCSTNYTKL